MKVRRGAVCLGTALLSLASPAFATSGSYVYVNNNTTPNTVSAFAVGPTGTLAAVPGSPFATGGNSAPCFVAADRANVVAISNLLYVSNSTPAGATISGFAIDPLNGALVPVAGSPFVVSGISECGMALASSGDGRFLAAGAEGRTFMFEVQPGGGLLAVPGSPFPASPGTAGLGMSPDRRFLTLAQVTNRLQTFAISPTGTLTFVQSLAASAPTNAEYTCDGTRMIAGRATGISLYAAASNGTLAPRAATPPANTQSIAIAVDDAFVFGNTGLSVVSYAIGSTTLTHAGTSPNPGGNAPVPLAVSGDGKFLFALGNLRVNVFTVGATGTLGFAGSAAVTGAAGAIAAYPAKRCLPPDVDAPTTTAVATPAANVAGWNNTDVTVTLTATDTGSGVKAIHYTLSGAQTGSQTVSGDTAVIGITAEGITEITFHAEDEAGNQAAARTYTVRIDKTAPALSCSVDTPILWPPNHALVPVNATVTVSDAGSGSAGFTLTSATSSEPDNGLGDGDTADDIQGVTIGTSATRVLLRAERAGHGEGRTYTLSYSAADIAGNATSCTTTVFVPRNRR